jgi:uncharacterized membrane protein YheB (UPF0754 family)
MLLKIGILAIIGAFIGWMTNVFAIKLLFRPFQPINILGFKLQGLIPKRKEDIAKNVGETIEQELVTIEEILDKIIEDVDKSDIKQLIQDKINTIIKEKLSVLIPPAIKELILGYVNDFVKKNGDDMIDELTEKMIHKATQKVDISKMIEEKIIAFDMAEVERIVLEVAKKELKHIEYLGGVIGFVIGIVQGLIILNL